MGADTKIEWCDATANFWEGCTQISPACDFCYAKARAERFGSVEWNGPPRAVKAGAGVIRGMEFRAIYHPEWTPFIFVNSLSDFFDKLAPPQWRASALKLMIGAQRSRFLLLTKRIGNVERMIEEAGHGWPPNAWLGITVVNQEEADRDVPKLLTAKAALQIPRVFLSIEPMLGPIDLLRTPAAGVMWDYLTGERTTAFEKRSTASVDWVICGGESGKDARPMHPDWARSLRDQCAAAGVPFHFKQWGEWGPCELKPAGFAPIRVLTSKGRLLDVDKGLTEASDAGAEMICRFGKARAGRLLDGVEHNGRPLP